MSADRRPRIYLLHGLLATSYAHFGSLIERWRDAYDIVPIDLPGHGRSRHDARAPYYATCVDLLRRYTSELGPGHVIGASYLGGSVALRCALVAPAALRSVVLCGYVPNAPHPVVTRWTESFVQLAAQDDELARHYDQLHGSRWRATLELVLAEIRTSYPTAVAVRDEALAAIEVPTLVLNGSLKSDERAAAARLPALNHRIDAGIVPGAGHIPSHDEPDLFGLTVERFWQRLERPTPRESIRNIIPRRRSDDAAQPGERP